MRSLYRLLILTVGVLMLAACAPSPYHQTQGPRFQPIEPSAAQTRDSRPCGDSYTVRRNDTLSHIAVRCRVGMRALAAANQLQPPYVIHPGQTLVIPTDQPRSRQQEVRQAEQSMAQQDHIAAPASQGRWLWPIEGPSRHQYVQDTSGLKGLEIYVDSGTEVRAVDAGVVVYADNSISNFGLMVIIRHDRSYLTIYAHNSSLQVAEGQTVDRGQVIAHSGNTGATDRPKLYFEARQHGRKTHADALWR